MNFVTEIVYLGDNDRIVTWQGGLKGYEDSNIKMLGKIRTSFHIKNEITTFNTKDVIKLYKKYPKLSKAWEKFLIEY